MTKKELTATAAALPGFKDSAAREYGEKREAMLVRINEYMLARPDILELVGATNIEMMKDNHANHGLFIESMLKNFNAAVLVETISWVFSAYRSRHFHVNYWAAQLNAWNTVMKQTLTEESYKNIEPLYNWMTINIPQFTAITDMQES